MARDAIAEIIAYNRPGEGPAEATAEALRRKLSALANTPFQFLRGTFHLMACDVLQSRVSLARGTAPVGLIVGDLHLENFGVYRGRSGVLVFDVNEFDDVRVARVDPQWSERAREAFAEYLEHLKQLKAPDPPKGGDVLDVAYRFKGTGSLGRLRFTLLVGQRGERRLVEMKEARQSAMDQALGKAPERERARVQTAAIRRLQGDPWPRVAATRLGGIPTLARENEPEDEKIGRELLAKDDGQLLSYARQCGRVLARLHARVNAPVLLGAAWDRAETAHAAVEFAERYAVQVEADQKKFVAAKEQVSRALAIS